MSREHLLPERLISIWAVNTCFLGASFDMSRKQLLPGRPHLDMSCKHWLVAKAPHLDMSCEYLLPERLISIWAVNTCCRNASSRYELWTLVAGAPHLEKGTRRLTMATIALFSASEQTHSSSQSYVTGWVTVSLHTAFSMSTEVVPAPLVVTWLVPRDWNYCRLGASSVHTIKLCTSLQGHFIRSHVRRVYVCLAVSCQSNFNTTSGIFYVAIRAFLDYHYYLRSWSLCQKCKWQVIAKWHTRILRIWLPVLKVTSSVIWCMVYAYTERAPRWQQLHLAPAKTLRLILKFVVCKLATVTHSVACN